MADNQKEQERTALRSTIWNIANELRGSVDGWDFKQYVLGMLFYRFISENLTNFVNQEQQKAGEAAFNYANLTNDKAELARKHILEVKGFFILPSELFANVRTSALNPANKKHTEETLNQTLDAVFKNISNSAKGSASEDNIKGLFDDINVNSKKLGATVIKRNQTLVKLLTEIGRLNLGNYGDNSIDLFGDAYEYLMTMYAANAGKSGGEFFTPQEVSELLALITVVGKTQVNKVYDPACGSGSLLLKFAKILGKENVTNGFFGQEINHTTYNLCRINMFLHDINYEQFAIANADTLTEPYLTDEEPFEAIVSNPPYSTKWQGDANATLINDPRFAPAGVLAPKSKADLAFVMHVLSWLATNGTAAIVSFPGVMYRGGAEQKIRKYLVANNFVAAVIQLPTDLFFGTTIATCILVLKKNKQNNSVLFIDATNEFKRGSAKNKLTSQHITKILNCYTKQNSQEHFSRLVSQQEISENNYNLSVGSYVAPKDETEVIDISELNSKISKIVSKQQQLRTAIDAIVADLEGDANG